MHWATAVTISVALLFAGSPNATGAAQLTPNQVMHHRCAIEDLDQAKRFIAPIPELLYVRGRSHQALGQYAQAVEAFDTQLAMRPDDEAARNCRKAARLRTACALAPDASALVAAWYKRPNLAKSDADWYRWAERYVASRYPGDEYDVLGPYPFERFGYHMAAGHFDVALVLYDNMAKLHPNYAGAIEGRGNVFAARGRFEQAIAEFTKAIGMLPTIEETLAAIVEHDARWRRGEEEAYTILDIRSNMRVGSLGHLISIHEARGHAYAKLGRLEEAWADYLRVLDLVPAHDAARRALERMKPFLEVQASLTHEDAALPEVPAAEAFRDRPITRTEAYRYIVGRYGPNPENNRNSVRYRLAWRGQDYVHRGMHDTAHEHFRRYLASNPDFDFAWRYLGDLHMVMHNYAAAVQSYTRAIEASNHPFGLYARRARAYWALGQVDLAIADFSTEIGTYKWHGTVVSADRGRAYAETGRHDLAVADLKAYLEDNSTFAEAHHYLAESLAMLGAFDEALEHEAEAVKLAPRYAAAYELKALMHYAIASSGAPDRSYPACRAQNAK